jgi:hypothetical protein
MKRHAARSVNMIVSTLLLAGVACAQLLVSGKSGMIQYVVGDVFLDGKSLNLSNGEYVQMDNGQSLLTGYGLAEMLVTANTYLRMGTYSLLKMERNRIVDTLLVLEKGSVLIEIVKRKKENRIQIRFAASVVEFKKNGLYRLDVLSHQLMVYGGEAQVMKGDKKTKVKSGRAVDLDTNLEPSRFDVSEADSLHYWAAIRSYVLFMSSPSARTQKHWPELSLGWRMNFNYRIRLHPEVLFEVIKKNLPEELFPAQPEQIDWQ